MNRAESLTYEPTGIGLRWIVDQLHVWLHPRKLEPRKKNVEFCRAVAENVTEFPRSLHELYQLMPIQFRTVQDYRNLETQLRRMTKDGRVARIGSTGSYKYGRK